MALRFEQAADAVVAGDAATLTQLLREDPELVRARSTRAHRATLLHYVAANGVEQERQRTPQNIVEIAELLLRAGAEVDATASAYGVECTTLELAATSIHPERAGVQQALLSTLLDHGARLEAYGRPIVDACLANNRLRAAEYLSSRGAQLGLAAAAGLGRLQRVETLLTQPQHPPQAERQQSLRFAAAYGRDAVLKLLIERGAADLSAQDANGQTALHWAVIGGHPSTVSLLLGDHPPLETQNTYGGTPLGQAMWSAAHGGDAEVYLGIMQALLAAGAKLPKAHAPIHPKLDAWLAEQGSQVEPSWSWSA